MTKEILDGGAAPAHDAGEPDPGDFAAPGNSWTLVVTGRRRWMALGLAGVLLLGGGWWLRSSASRLESPEAVTGPSGALPASAEEEAAWVAPILPPGAAFSLTVQVADRLIRIEHGPQRTRQIVFPGRVSRRASGWATAAETVVLAPGGAGHVVTVLDATGRPLRQLGPGVRILAGPQGRSAWVVRGVPGGGFTLQGHGLDGTTRGPAAAVPAGTEPVAVLRDAVVLTNATRALFLWRVGGGEPVRLRVSGRVVSAAQGLILVAHNCAGGQRCDRSLVNIASGRVTRLRGAPGMRTLGEPVLSRDGLWVAMMVEPDAGDTRAETALAVATVFDGGAAPRIVPGTRSALVSAVVIPAWSLDGQVFGYAPGGAGLYAYQPGDAGARRLDVPGLGAVTRIAAG